MPKGEITVEYTFWCGLCNEWYQEANAINKKDAMKIVRRLDWHLTKQDGWVCPKHFEKVKL